MSWVASMGPVAGSSVSTTSTKDTSNMGWIGAAVAAVGSIAQSQSAKKAAKDKEKSDKASTALEAVLERQNKQFGAEQDYYYDRLGKKNQERGMSEFRKFSGMKRIDPAYKNTAGGIVLPDKPEFDQGRYAVPVEAPKGKKGRGFFQQHLDPAKLIFK